MKILKRLSALMLAMLLLLSFAACGGKDGGEDSDVTDAPETNYEREVKTKIAALNGPTGLGLAEIKADRSYAYDVEYYSDPQEVGPLLIKGEVDIAALPLNMAANLYKKTDGKIKMLAINTLGVLHVLSRMIRSRASPTSRARPSIHRVRAQLPNISSTTFSARTALSRARM